MHSVTGATRLITGTWRWQVRSTWTRSLKPWSRSLGQALHGRRQVWASPWPCAASWWRQVRAPCAQSLRSLAERVHRRSAPCCPRGRSAPYLAERVHRQSQCCDHGWSGRGPRSGPRNQRGEVCGRCGASPTQQRTGWRTARGATMISDAFHVCVEPSTPVRGHFNDGLPLGFGTIGSEGCNTCEPERQWDDERERQAGIK